MLYYSTNKQESGVSLRDVVIKGLADDKGLYMPNSIPVLPDEFYRNIDTMSLQEISFYVAGHLFGEDIPKEDLKQIIYDTLSFDIPLVKVNDSIYSLELFHGPTLAFKDVGARFMSRMRVILSGKRLRLMTWCMFWSPLPVIRAVPLPKVSWA